MSIVGEYTFINQKILKIIGWYSVAPREVFFCLFYVTRSFFKAVISLNASSFLLNITFYIFPVV